MVRIMSLGNKNAARELKEDYRQSSSDLAYIVGVLMGDGYLSKGTIGLNYTATDSEFGDVFAEAFKRQFGIRMCTYDAPAHTGSIRDRDIRTAPWKQTKVYSLEAYEFLLSIENPTWVRSLPSEQRIAWLRGAWDSEGSLSKHSTRNTYYVKWAVCDESFARLYRDMLKETTGIRVRISFDGKSYHVDFGTRTDVERFFSMVSPTIQRKVEKFKQMEPICPPRQHDPKTGRWIQTGPEVTDVR